MYGLTSVSKKKEFQLCALTHEVTQAMYEKHGAGFKFIYQAK